MNRAPRFHGSGRHRSVLLVAALCLPGLLAWRDAGSDTCGHATEWLELAGPTVTVDGVPIAPQEVQGLAAKKCLRAISFGEGVTLYDCEVGESSGVEFWGPMP